MRPRLVLLHRSRDNVGLAGHFFTTCSHAKNLWPHLWGRRWVVTPVQNPRQCGTAGHSSPQVLVEGAWETMENLRPHLLDDAGSECGVSSFFFFLHNRSACELVQWIAALGDARVHGESLAASACWTVLGVVTLVPMPRQRDSHHGAGCRSWRCTCTMEILWSQM